MNTPRNILTRIGKAAGLLALLATTFFMNPFLCSTLHYPSPLASKHYCASNMKTIESVLELYIIEHPEQAAAGITVSSLVPDYLKTVIRCSKAHGYELIRTPKPEGGFHRDVRCPLHGNLSQQQGEDSQKGLIEVEQMQWRLKRLTQFQGLLLISGFFVALGFLVDDSRLLNQGAMGIIVTLAGVLAALSFTGVGIFHMLTLLF